MTGEHERCKATLFEIAEFPFSTYAQQSMLIDLALCLQSLNEIDETKKIAERIVKLDRHSNQALHARAILIELDTDDPDREQKLVRLENLCRKNGATIVANNIALDRAQEVKDDPDRIRQILQPVVKLEKDKSDFYNRTRAAIRLADLSLKAGEKLNESELRYLIGAYHYLFNERLPGLFDQCHDSLWRVFETASETGNLLALFRHSSLYWRLIDNDKQETKYLKKLANKIGNTISEKIANLSREAAYYLVRAASQAFLIHDGGSSTPKK